MRGLCNYKNYARKTNWIQSKACFGDFGVFARQDILRGEVIEECPVALRDYYDVNEDHFSYVVLDHNRQYVVTAFGLGSIYNHENIPNAHWFFDVNEKILVIYALQDIKTDEEIRINYRIEKNYSMEEFDLRTALAAVPLDEYDKLTFKVDLSDLIEYIQGSPAPFSENTSRSTPRE
jgi:hypothetical protein